MSPNQKEATIHSVVMFAGGLLAVGLSWLVGALTNHAISLPVLLVPFTGLIVALAEYTYHQLTPQPTPQSLPTPVPVGPVNPPAPVNPPTPPAPPAGGTA